MENFISLKVEDLSGSIHEILAPTDMAMNLMEAIRANDIPIKATCGGMALCATCHCIVKSNHQLPEMLEAEEAMLDDAFLLEIPNSRLSCQIQIDSKLDGLEIKLGKSTSTSD